ncbi:MAG: TatD family hydrolase [Promethearchaeota archaeon]
MGKKLNIPEPEDNLPFIDTHCHVPWTEGKSRTGKPAKQLKDFLDVGGEFLITCSIDMKSAPLVANFARQNENVHFSCGMAPQTVTYTPRDDYEVEFGNWKEFSENNIDEIITFGEIGLDFHHAKTLEKRNLQVKEFKNILSFIVNKNKPVVLHVRNAGPADIDRDHPDHKFNNKDGAMNEILKQLKAHGINTNQTLFHCYSGPATMNDELAKMGFMFSVPSSAFGNNRWYKMSKSIPLHQLVTETDSPFQHPYLYKPTNVPSNARYSIAAIAHSHGIPQEEVAKATVENARRFFNIK